MYDRSEAALYFKNKSIKKEEVEELRLDFDDRVRRVRHFWCDQIYKELSRPGKLLKYSMQHNSQ